MPTRLRPPGNVRKWGVSRRETDSPPPEARSQGSRRRAKSQLVRQSDSRRKNQELPSPSNARQSAKGDDNRNGYERQSVFHQAKLVHSHQVCNWETKRLDERPLLGRERTGRLRL